MQVSVENTSNLGRRLTIEIPEEIVKIEENAKINDFAKNAKIEGFRPGKVPADYIKKKYGEQIHQDAVTQVIQTSLGKALQERNMRPANRPNVEELKDEANLIYTVTFEVYPDIELADLSKVQLERAVPDITDKDIDSGIEKLQDQFATFTEVADRKSKKEDKVTIDFEGYMDGEKFDNGSANDFELELGSNSFIPGFEDGVVGMKIGDEKTISLKFPKEYGAKDLAGKPVEFKVTLKKIQEKLRAPVDAEFAEKIGIEDKDVDKVRDRIKENMIKYVEDLNKNKLREQALEKLYEVNKFDVPESIVEQEQHSLLHEKHGKEAKTEDLSKADLKTLHADAKKRVAIGLLLNEIISKHNLQPEQERMLAKMQQMARMYGGNPEMIQKMFSESKELRQNVQNMVLTDQAADFVVAGATIKDKKSKFYDIVNAKE